MHLLHNSHMTATSVPFHCFASLPTENNNNNKKLVAIHHNFIFSVFLFSKVHTHVHTHAHTLPTHPKNIHSFKINHEMRRKRNI